MLLGSIIANLSDETSILETLASLDDLVLLARMREAAAASWRTSRQLRKCAVWERFVARADDAAWLSLMAVTSKADDPGKACLRYILRTEMPVSKPPVPVTTDASQSGRQHAHDGRTGAHP